MIDRLIHQLQARSAAQIEAMQTELAELLESKDYEREVDMSDIAHDDEDDRRPVRTRSVRGK